MAGVQSPLVYHLINPGINAVQDGLSGLTKACPSRFIYEPETNVLYRSDIEQFRQNHVTIVAAAGGGHEPMFAGYVGKNGVSAFVSGAVFAAPTGAQMLAAIRQCKSPKGTILVMGNYTGDVLNAGLAITRAQSEGINVQLLVVGDDVAVGRQKGGLVGRRGLCGHLIALKAICPLVEQGCDLDKVSQATRWIVERVGTIAMAFDRCALPSAISTTKPASAPDTVELGMGAHGEPGLLKITPIPEARELVQRMVKLLIDQSDTDRGFIDVEEGSSVVLMVNNLGGMAEEVVTEYATLAVHTLQQNHIGVERLMYGPFVTSLRMSGIGLAIGRVPNTAELGSGLSRKEFLDCWDTITGTVSWINAPSMLYG